MRPRRCAHHRTRSRCPTHGERLHVSVTTGTIGLRVNLPARLTSARRACAIGDAMHTASARCTGSVERATLRLLIDADRLWTADAVGQELGAPLAVRDALFELMARGLVDELDGHVYATGTALDGVSEKRR